MDTLAPKYKYIYIYMLFGHEPLNSKPSSLYRTLIVRILDGALKGSLLGHMEP